LYELVEFEKAFNGKNVYFIFKAILENPIPELKDEHLNMIIKK
jgi:hypothetical protein